MRTVEAGGRRVRPSAGQDGQAPVDPSDVQVIGGPVRPEDLVRVASTLADRWGRPAAVEDRGDAGVLRIGRDRASIAVTWHRDGWGAAPPDAPACGDGYRLIIISRLHGRPDASDRRMQRERSRSVRDLADTLTTEEVAALRRSMPLVERFSARTGELDGWALIFRDHYVGDSAGFLLGMERAGIPASSIYALAKGDRTLDRQRYDAFFRQRGWRSGLVDNAWVDGRGDGPAATSEEEMGRVSAFIEHAHATGRQVLVVDDGGLVALGYGDPGPGRPAVDAAIELTVSGLKRIARMRSLGIPIFDLATSALKRTLGYKELADACTRRLIAILPVDQLAGKRVTLLGFGTLGARLAARLRARGARLLVVDTDYERLCSATEDGYDTATSLAEALSCCRPFLVVGCSGEVALTAADIPLLPDGLFLAGFATRDFSALLEAGLAEKELPGFGSAFEIGPGRRVIRLGDGRSLNLFETGSVPNAGYDAYRAGTIVAAKALCASAGSLPPGLHRRIVDECVAASGLYEAYFDLHIGGSGGGR